jgi:hypothetical protein
MTVTTPAYCSRTDAQRAVDFTDGLLTNQQIDRAIQSAARNIEGHLHRLFYPWDGTKWWDYPNYQYASPWKLRLGRNDLQCLTYFASGGVEIPLNTVFFRADGAQKRPGFPWTRIELDRSSGSTFGGYSQTPQNAIQGIGTWGFTADADEVTTLAAELTEGGTAAVVADSSQVSAGDLLIIDYSRGAAPYPDDTLGHAGLIQPYLGERVLVQDTALADTGLAQEGSGCSTASSSDDQLLTGAGLNAGEVVVLDSEEMFILSLSQAGTVATVQRSWNGTQLATHSSAEIYAYRSLTLERGAQGTSGQQAQWAEGTAVWKHRVPTLIRDLNIAEATQRPLQETSGYARTVGGGDAAMAAPGAALADLWAEAMTEYGRQARRSAI